MEDLKKKRIYYKFDDSTHVDSFFNRRFYPDDYDANKHMCEFHCGDNAHYATPKGSFNAGINKERSKICKQAKKSFYKHYKL